MDSLSVLPDEIIAHILSFLSTKEAARTCTLSTRWRHLWKLTGRLLLQPYSAVVGSLSEHRSIRFVDSVLSSFQNPTLYPLRELFIVCNIFASVRDNVAVERWISFAVDLHNVQILDMSLFNHQNMTESRFPLPSSCNRINNLMHLKISCCKILPSFECFPNLRSITLERGCIVTDAAIASINLNCTLLERLLLYGVRQLEQIRVSSSFCSLKHLAICHCDDLKTVLIESPSLEGLEIGMGRHWKPTPQGLKLFAPLLKELSLCCCEDMSATLALIEGSTIGTIEKLGLTVNHTDDLNFDVHRPPPLNHVKELGLKVYEASNDLKGLCALLRATSSLESLCWSSGYGRHFRAPTSAGNLKLHSLKRIRIQEFDYREYSHLSMLKYLVKVAVRLAEIEIVVKSQFFNDLSESKRPIENCMRHRLWRGLRLVIRPAGSPLV